jgi:hypothetical protein
MSRHLWAAYWRLAKALVFLANAPGALLTWLIHARWRRWTAGRVLPVHANRNP